MGAVPPPVPATDPRKPRFWEVALANGLFTLAQLETAESTLRSQPGLVDGDRAAWDAALADRLVEQGVLTRYQARELLAGRTVFRLGAYLFLDELGKGGMGQVFKAEHELMGRLVAVKVLPRSKWTPESEAAFRREMRILGRLDHPNLVRAFDAGYEKQVNYLVTELVPGLNLRQLVRQTGPLSEYETASVFSQVATGLAYAHEQGLVHRDVKPGNIIVMEDGRAKLLDLGLAGSTLEAEAVRLGRVVGTMDYIAPEQIREPDDVGPSADIYGLGCSMYFALSGRVPFPDGSSREKMQRHLHERPPPLRSLVPQASEAFCLLVEAMMEKSPTDRIDAAAEVIRRLRRWTPAVPLPLPRPEGGSAARGGSPGPWWRRLAGPAVADAAGRGAAVIGAGSPPIGRLVRDAGRMLLVAAGAGAVFYGCIWALRGLNEERFRQAFGGSTPGTFGLVAFGAIFLLQIVVALSDGRAD